MGVGQNAMLGLVGAAGVTASKVAGVVGGDNQQNQALTSMLAEQSANKGLLDEYTKEQTNMLRVKPMLEKTGKWDDAHEQRLKNINEKVNLYSQADVAFTEKYRKAIGMGGKK